MGETQLAKYEHWYREVEARRAELVRDRPGYTKLFVAMPIVSLVAFVGGVGIGVGALLTAIMMSAFGFYTVLFRLGEYRRELERLRHDIARLAEEAP